MSEGERSHPRRLDVIETFIDLVARSLKKRSQLPLVRL
jgi:hypothetical protein